MSSRTRAAGRCTACGRAFAVWRSSEGTVVPIGSVDGCPCGEDAFQLLTNTVQQE